MTIYHDKFLPYLGKHVKPLVPVVLCRSLTVVIVRRKPENLTTSLNIGIKLALDLDLV